MEDKLDSGGNKRKQMTDCYSGSKIAKRHRIPATSNRVYQKRAANPPSELRNKLPLKVASHVARRAKVLGGRLESVVCTRHITDKALG